MKTVDKVASQMNYTNYQRGIVQGRYVGKKVATYTKKHSRCTKHGWYECDKTQENWYICPKCEQEGED